MGYIEAINISQKKGIVKKEIESAEFRVDWGIVDDAHAGNWHRQVSLLAGESIDAVKEKIPSLSNGAFAENVITRGIDIAKLKIGEKLSLNNEVIIEVTQIGKECHTACIIQTITGDCIMPKEGVFGKVLQGGFVKSGDSFEVANSITS